MESNHSGLKKSNKIGYWSSDDQLLGSASVNKSYTCTFCKRGFSNAQALGGHMNIHRKERAKLRQAADENLLTLDITRSSDTSKPAKVFAEKGSFQQRFSSVDDGACASRNKDGVREVDQLLILADAETLTVPVREHMNHVLSPEELDLELRLGPEPHVK